MVSLKKLDFVLVTISSAAVVAIAAGIILQLAIKPDEFSNTGFFLYWLKISVMATLSFSMIAIGLSKIRLRENLKLSTICFVLGLLLGLVYGVGGIHKNRIFSYFLEEKNQLIDKIAIGISGKKSDELCEYSLSLVRSIYYLRGEVTTYSTCDGKISSFSPTNMDIDQRNHVLFIENSANRARDTSIFFFVILIVAILIGLVLPKSREIS